VPHKWPLALDLLKRQIDTLYNDHAFERFNPYFDIAETVPIEFFGLTGYFTTDPENLKLFSPRNSATGAWDLVG
jgi:hypothetical protein